MMVLPLLLRLCFAVSTTTLEGAAPPEPSEKSPEAKLARAAELVEALGNRRFAVREAAARELLALGRFAKAALKKGCTHPDAEVRDRCRTLLPQAMQLDLEVRMQRFLADKDGKADHDVPGWKQFREIVGNDPKGRDLYIEIFNQIGDMLDLVEEDPAQAPEQYLQYGAQLFTKLFGPALNGRRETPSFGTFAGFLLLGTFPKTDETNPAPQQINFFYRNEFRMGLTTGETASAGRKLFIRWLEMRRDSASISQGLSVLTSLQLKEGLPIALRAANDKNLNGYVRANAIIHVGRTGTKENVAALLPALDDKTQITAFNFNNKQGIVQLRDVALAMIISLHDQDPKAFGYEMLPNSSSRFSYYYLGFESDEKRAESKKKWDEWLSKN